jgi:predicted metalloprotease with PDZ domain
MNSTPAIQYRIEALDPLAHVFETRCTVATPASTGQRFRLPTWTPGSYLVREFARQFIDVRAENASGTVAIVKTAKDVWQAAPCRGPLTVIARIYAHDVSVRTAYLDATRGYFNGAAVFLCPEGLEDAPCWLDIALPAGEPYDAWRIATTLPSNESAGERTSRFRAANYDELIDHPVEMSDFASCSFVAGGVTHDIAITGRQGVDGARLTADLARVCQWQIDLFGGAAQSRAPFDRYLFQALAVGDGYGGLEHRSSTSLVCRRESLPQPGMTEPTDDYVTFLGLASHEYFHVWNVKRIKPQAFTPLDLSRESYTRQLWAFEGITSYYDDLALVRSGVVKGDRFLELLGRTITTVLRTPGRHVQSVADSSFDAWIKFYRQDENSPNAMVSYYQKGSLIALALDLTLRETRHASHDDVMRTLYERYGVPGVGVPEDGIQVIASELAGRDLGDFFARYVSGTEDPPLAALLAGHGIKLELRAAASATDRGGTPGKNGPQLRCSIGAKLGNDLKLQHVYTDGPAERAGFAPGDTLIAFDGIKASADALALMLERRAPGSTLAVHAFRRDELMQTEIILAAAPLDTCYLVIDEDAAPAIVDRRASWLGSTALEPH